MSKTWKKHDGSGRYRQAPKDRNKTKKENKKVESFDMED